MVDRTLVVGALLVVPAVVAAVVGCGATPRASTSATASPDSSPPSENLWARMSFEARHERMTFTVLPSMAVRFREHYRTEHAELTCVSCHGPDAEARDYAMPASLPPLDSAAMPGGPDARFMAEVVVPSMDRMMRAGGTVTCFSCHPSVRTP